MQKSSENCCGGSHWFPTNFINEAGPAATKRAVATMLEKPKARGELSIPDLDYEAWQSVNLAFGEFRILLLVSLIEQVSGDRLDAHLRRVVEDLLQL